MIEIEPAIIIRAFIGMIMHHSLNNNLWDRKRTLLRISNQTAARAFTRILLHGVTTTKAHSVVTINGKKGSKRKKASK